MNNSSTRTVNLRPSILNRYLMQASALKVFIILIGSLTLAEVAVMMLLHAYTPNLPPIFAAIVDSLLLLLCIFPALYLLVFRPLTIKIARLNTAENSLRESETTVMALMNSLNESAFLIAADGTLITLNLTAAQRLGTEREQIIGTNFYDQFPSEVATVRRTKVEQSISTGKIVTFDDIRNNRHYDITICPIANSLGVVVKLAIFGFDTTSYRETEHLLKTNALALERSNNEVRLLGKMSETLQSCRSLDEAYAVLAKFANQLFPEESGGLFILDANRNLLELVSYWGDFWTTSDGISPEDCWGMRRGRLHVFRDNMIDVQCAHLGESGDFHYYCLPLMARSETLGLLHMRMAIPLEGAAGRVVLEAKEQLLESMGEHMALAIANLRLRDLLHTLSTRDPLTAVFNRRFMEESLKRELHQADRRRSHVGIIMLDVDHFKRFNDTYGHDAGDLLLRELGSFLKEHVRGGDIICRYGGEEFIIIMPGAGEHETMERAENLRVGIKSIIIQQGVVAPEAVSVSMGVAVYPENGNDPQRLLKSVDEALYRAKNEGRDRICMN